MSEPQINKFCEIELEGAQAMTILGALIWLYISHLGTSASNANFFERHESKLFAALFGAISMVVIGAISWTNHDKGEC
jgi:hypothetical protein